MRESELEENIKKQDIKEGDLVRVSWENTLNKTWRPHIKVFRFLQMVDNQLLIYNKDGSPLNDWHHIPIEKIFNMLRC